MGVAGSGKTTVGVALAAVLGARFVEGDDHHPPANVAKMAAGVALTDDDRWPWLARLRDELTLDGDVVLTCSALKRRYRDLLRGAGDVRFVFLDVDATTAGDRAAHRSGHFMGPGMVAGQFEALERPASDEADVLRVDATGDVAGMVASIRRALTGADQ